jgi:hypothetical protein
MRRLMARLLATCVLGVSIALASAQSVIKEVKELPSGDTISRGGIFNPDSGLSVKLDRSAIPSTQPETDAAVAGQIKDFNMMAKAAKLGLVGLGDFQATGNIEGVSQSLNAVIEVVRKYPEFYEPLNIRMATVTGFIPKARVAFEEATKLAEAKIRELVAKVPVVRVQLILSRNNDLSRIPDAPLGVLPGQESKDALKALMETLKGSDGGVTFDSMQKALVAKVMADIDSKVAALKTSAAAFITKYEGRVSELELKLRNTPEKDAWNSLKNEILDLKAKFQTFTDQLADLKSKAQAIAGGDLSFETISQFSNGIRELEAILSAGITKYNSIQAQFTSLIALTDVGADAILNEFKNALESAVKDAQTFIEKTVTSAKDVIMSAAAMLNLVDKLEKIDETFKDTTDDTVEFANDDGVLQGMKTALRSYDEVKIVAMTKDSAGTFNRLDSLTKSMPGGNIVLILSQR